jgi:tetratricopeptide (TPR) repeat protein
VPQSQRSPSGAFAVSPSSRPRILIAELGEMRERIVKRSEDITRQDYFAMLGVAKDAEVEAIQKAYFLLAKVWHPDRLPRELDDVRDACSKVFAHMSEAHQTLTDPERRLRYETLMKEGGATPEDQEQIGKVLDAATNFQKAEICLRRNDLPQAEHFVRLAAEADPMQADYVALLAWLEAMKPENQSAPATERRIGELNRAIKLNDKCSNAYFYRGVLYKRIGNEKEAYKDFKQAADLNPRNIDAIREVRIYAMRKGSQPPPVAGGKPVRKPPEPPPGGIFGKLFKK